MARLEEGEVAILSRSIDPAKEIAAVLGGNRGWTHTIESELEGCELAMDRLRFRHIVVNLISNAVTHGGDRVMIKAGRSGDRYKVVVADDGLGVPAHQLNQLFEPFVDDAPSTVITGTLGLGLAVARRLAVQMKCSLEYRREGGLTFFTLAMPLTPVSTAPIRSRTYPTP
jgi:signal transduction histidine kinase